MPEPIKVLTTGEKIPDITPAVEQLKQEVAVVEAVAEKGVSQEQHQVVQKEIDVNAAAILELQKTAKDAAALITQAAADAVVKLKEAAGTAATKVTAEADKATQEVTTINEGRPLAPTTTASEDETISIQRRLAIQTGWIKSIIAVTVTLGYTFLSVYAFVTNSPVPFPASLATTMGALILYFFQTATTVISGAPANNTPGLAKGGPVTKGVPVIIGEKGREKFVPTESGTIIPNKDLPMGYVVAALLVVPTASILGVWLLTRI